MTAPFQLPPVVWADDLLNEPEPEHHWIVPDLFEQRDRAIITGNEGEGKSTLLRQWALMVALGVHPLTLVPIEPKRVLLIDLENSREQIKVELRKISEQAGVVVPGQPWLAIASWPSGLNLVSNDYELAFKEQIKAYSPDLVIGGPLYKMAEASLADENASRAVSAALDRLRADYHFALVLEAHQINESNAFDPAQKKFVKNRPPRPFGSSLWRRWPEFGLCLFTDGTLYHWRGDRQARAWPQKLSRGSDVWLWEPDTDHCPVCGKDRPDGKERYCSETCRNTAKKRRQRTQGKQGFLEELDSLSLT